MNTYGYVGGDPINYTDPTGRDPLVVFGTLIGGAAGAIQAANEGGGWTSGNAYNIIEGASVGAIIGAAAGLTPTEWGPLATLVTGAIAGGGGNFIGQATSAYNAGACTAFTPNWQAVGTQALVGASTGLLGFGSGLGYALNLVDGGSSSAAALGAGAWLNATTAGATQIVANDFISTRNGGFLPPINYADPHRCCAGRGLGASVCVGVCSPGDPSTAETPRSGRAPARGLGGQSDIVDRSCRLLGCGFEYNDPSPSLMAGLDRLPSLHPERGYGGLEADAQAEA